MFLQLKRLSESLSGRLAGLLCNRYLQGHTHTHSTHARRQTQTVRTVVNVSVPLLLHGHLEAVVQDLVECVDPVVHLGLAVGRQQVRALILHLQLEGKAPHLVVLQLRKGLEKHDQLSCQRSRTNNENKRKSKRRLLPVADSFAKVCLISNGRRRSFSFSTFENQIGNKVRLKECSISPSKANVLVLPAQPKAHRLIIKSNPETPHFNTTPPSPVFHRASTGLRRLAVLAPANSKVA